MQVNGAKATSHQNVSPGADTKVGISPPEVTLTPKRALSCLSLSPTFHLEVYRSPSVKECRDGVLVKEGSHVTSPQLTTMKQTSVARRARFEAGSSVLHP